MGKGDRKTAKGKRNISSYGNARGTGIAAKAPVVKKAAAPASKATAAKKAPAKKPRSNSALARRMKSPALRGFSFSHRR